MWEQDREFDLLEELERYDPEYEPGGDLARAAPDLYADEDEEYGPQDEPYSDEEDEY
jgi:hypothetical protein